MRIYGNTTNTALQINLLQWFSPFRWLNCEIALSSNYKWQLQTQGPLNLSLTQPNTHTHTFKHSTTISPLWMVQDFICTFAAAESIWRHKTHLNDGLRRFSSSDRSDATSCPSKANCTFVLLFFFFSPFPFLVDFLKQKGLRRHKQTDTVKCY